MWLSVRFVAWHVSRAFSRWWRVSCFEDLSAADDEPLYDFIKRNGLVAIWDKGGYNPNALTIVKQEPLQAWQLFMKWKASGALDLALPECEEKVYRDVIESRTVCGQVLLPKIPCSPEVVPKCAVCTLSSVTTSNVSGAAGANLPRIAAKHVRGLLGKVTR